LIQRRSTHSSECALEGDFVSLVAVVDVSDVALLGHLHSFSVGKFHESPKEHTGAGGLAAMEAVCAALLAHVLKIEVGLAAQGLNGLVDDSLRLAGIFLRNGSVLRRGAGIALRSDTRNRESADDQQS
jgi:hypothetical protein